jgi:hypothetical protein
VAASTFPYSGSRSVPQDQITYQSDTNGKSVSESWNVGLFGGDFQGSYSGTTTEDSSVTVDVPDWQVTPSIGDETVTYDWQTVTPASWLGISSGGGSWDLNDLNLNDFNPATLTTWQGDATWGPVSVTSKRTITSSDHYSVYDGLRGQTQLFANNDQVFDNSPDSRFPSTNGTTPGAGIDLCDSSVMAPAFKSNCAAENAAS